MKKFLYCTLFLLIPIGLYAQRTLTHNAGRDFYLTSIVNRDYWTGTYNDTVYDHYNDPYPDTAVIFVMGKLACEGYVENPQTGYREDFTVAPFEITEIRVPENQIMGNYFVYQFSSIILNKGIYLHTEEEVYVFMQSNLNYYDTNQWWGSRHIFYIGKMQILPIENFSDELIISQHPHNLHYLFIATEDDTEISVSIDGELLPQFSTSLNKGEIFAFCFNDSLFSEYHYPQKTKITSNCKPFVTYATGNYYGPTLIYPFPSEFSGHDFIFFFKGDGYYRKYFHLEYLFRNIDYTIDFYNIPSIQTSTGVAILPQDNTNLFYNWVSHGALSSDLPLYSKITDYISEVYINPNDSTDMMFSWYSDAYPTLPAEQMVQEAMFCTRTLNLINSDSVEFTINLVITPQDINSTYLNGELLSPSLFSTLPGIEDQYYFADFKLRENIPDILYFRNSNGLMADVREEAFYYEHSLWWMPIAKRIHQMQCRYHSGGNLQVAASLDEIALSPLFCLGDTLLLRALRNYENYPIDWIIDDAEYENQQEVRFPIPNLPGDSLLVTMIIHKHCPDTISQIVYIDLPPTIINLPADTLLCSGATLTLQSENANLIQWSDGSEGETLTVSSPGIYTVTASNDCHIRAIDSIHINLYPEMSLNFGEDTLLCHLITLLLDASQPHASQYVWQDSSRDATYLIRYDGQYWVIVTDPCESVSDSINVNYLLPFSLHLPEDTTLCEGNSLWIKLEHPYCDYLWSDGSTDHRYLINQSGTYSVTASNICYTTNGEITLTFENCRENPLHIPNAFTPNQDGVNDEFLPYFEYPEKIISYELLIYDRWGKLIFRTQNLQEGWDGGDFPTGSYSYFIRYKSQNIAEKIAKGSVTVVR